MTRGGRHITAQRASEAAPVPSPLRRSPLSRAESAKLNPSVEAVKPAGDAVSSGGRSLSPADRAFFEPRFGRDLSHVRLHTDAAAGRAAAGIGALAYTHRDHIAFAPGEYRPSTSEGRRLIAHELTHTLQQGAGQGLSLQRVCSTAAICSAPSIPGNPEDFSSAEAAAEASPRARRRAMTPARARSTGHAGRAAQLEKVLSDHDPSRRSLVHGIFIDVDLSSGTAAMVTDCADWAADALPSGDPDPSGFATATKDCVFVHGALNREAFAFNRGRATIGGQSRDAWRADALNTLIHETEHVRFETSIAPGLPSPGGISAPTCTQPAVEFALSEVVSIVSEFPLHFEDAAAEADPAGPAHARKNAYFTNAVTNPSESFSGALLSMGCSCECADVDKWVVQAVDAVTTGWTSAQKTEFRTEVQSQMLGPTRPIWPSAPTP